MQMIPPEYSSGKNVILILSLGYLVEMATGINQVIIANSKYYRFDAFSVLLMVGVIVISNMIFIPIYGISGSAIATAITIATNNILRVIFLKVKFGMQPYDINSLKLVMIALIAILPSFFIPYLNNLYIDIAVRSAVVGGAFILLILKLEAAPELNVKIRKNLKRVSISI
jgi:O-antigen/teichoic acid export membrane protein